MFLFRVRRFLNEPEIFIGDCRCLHAVEETMSAESFFSPHMAWLFAAVSICSAVVLGFTIRGVVRLVRQSRILSVPLREEQDIEFAESGRVVLCLEGPLFTRRFARLGYELAAADGSPVSGRPALFHARTSGFSTVRMEMRVYGIPRPGRYRLRIRGLENSTEADSRECIVFMRPHLGRAVCFIIGIVLSSGLFITGLVFSLLCFVPG